MTDAKTLVARLRALLAKASLGPWELAGDSPAHIVVVDDETGSIAGHIADAGRDDAELIAALRNAAPVLLDAAERAQGLEKALEATNERLLARIDQLMDAKPDTPEGSELQRLVDAVQPIEAVLYVRALKEPT